MLSRCLDRRRITVRVSIFFTLVALVVPLLFVVCTVQSTATTNLAHSASDIYPPDRMGLYGLAKRAGEDSADSTEADSDSTDKRVKTVDVKQCFWQSEIGETNTKPLTLVIGISLGSIAGIIICAFAAFQTGKSARGGGGMGMMQQPAY